MKREKMFFMSYQGVGGLAGFRLHKVKHWPWETRKKFMVWIQIEIKKIKDENVEIKQDIIILNCKII